MLALTKDSLRRIELMLCNDWLKGTLRAQPEFWRVRNLLTGQPDRAAIPDAVAKVNFILKKKLYSGVGPGPRQPAAYSFLIQDFYDVAEQFSPLHKCRENPSHDADFLLWA